MGVDFVVDQVGLVWARCWGGADAAFFVSSCLCVLSRPPARPCSLRSHSSLIIDGLTNSTQDQIFTLYPGYSGQQMMFIMASITLTILTPAMVLPLPSHPLALLTFATREAHAATTFAPPILLQSLRFIASHPSALNPLLAYAALGGLGQIFIFETIAHFGSLTLVMVTVTRKLFTMLLSVLVFGHELTPGQWGGVAVVFAGIGVEAAFKWAEGKKKKQKVA